MKEIDKRKKLKISSVLWTLNFFLYSMLSGMILVLYLINEINIFIYLTMCLLISIMIGKSIKEQDKTTIDLYKYETYKVI